MAFLTRESILNLDDILVETIVVPEWKGESIKIRSATAAERDAYEATLSTTKIVDDKAVTEMNFANAKARLLVKVILNEDGSRMFVDEDAVALGNKCAGVVARLFKRVQELSGMTPATAASIEKNSGTGQK